MTDLDTIIRGLCYGLEYVRNPIHGSNKGQAEEHLIEAMKAAILLQNKEATDAVVEPIKKIFCSSGKALILKALKANRGAMTARQIHIATDIYSFNVLRSTLSQMLKSGYLCVATPSHEFSETRPCKHYHISDKGRELLAEWGL